MLRTRVYRKHLTWHLYSLIPNHSTQPILIHLGPWPSNSHIRQPPTQPPRGDIPLNNSHIRRRLPSHGNQRPITVNLKRPGKRRKRARNLDEFEIARGGVNLVQGDGVLILPKRLIEAIRRVDKVVSYPHFGSLGARGGHLSGGQRPDGFLLREGETPPVRGILYIPRRNRVPQLINGKQNRNIRICAIRRAPKSAVARSIPPRRGRRGTFGEFSRGRIDGEDADDVGTEVAA